MTLTEFFGLISGIIVALGGLSALIIYFGNRKQNIQTVQSEITKREKEVEQIEQEIEDKHALQTKQWYDDLQEIKQKHDLELEKKDQLILDLQDSRITLVAELTAATLKLGQCGRAHRRLITALNIPYWECDHDGKLMFANGPWLKMFGLSKDEALGEGWLKAIPEDKKQELLVEWYSRVVDETDGKISFTIKNAVTGETTEAQAIYAVKFDTHSEVYKIIGVTINLDWVNWYGKKWREVPIITHL